MFIAQVGGERRGKILKSAPDLTMGMTGAWEGVVRERPSGLRWGWGSECEGGGGA